MRASKSGQKGMGSMRKVLFALMALVSQAGLLLISAPAFASEVFLDDTFNLADYTSSTVYTTPGTTLSVNQCTSCGNPGSGLQLIVTFSPSNDAQGAAVGLANTTFSYDPQTQGAIVSINASVDKNFSDTYPFGGTAGSSFHPLIEQAGNYYVASITGPSLTVPGSTGYNSISGSGLLATNFEEFDFATDSFVAAFPNFDGDPMLFGLAQLFSSGATTVTYTAEADYDNLQIALNTTPVPAALPLFAGGLGALGLFGWRRKRKARAVPG